MQSGIFEKAARQRAGLMGLITAILHDEEADAQTIKNRIVQSFAHLIEQGATVGDMIDSYVAEACQEHIQKSLNVTGAEDILKNLN